MGFLLRIWLVMTLIVVLAACASAPKGPLSLQAQLDHSTTITLPLIETPSELLLVKANLLNGHEGNFVVDTGATLTSIFPDMQTRLALMPNKTTSIRVHGMIAAQLQPLTELPSLNLGGTEMGPLPVAVIPRIKEKAGREARFLDKDYDGIIGMDVLSRYHLYIDKKAGFLKLIPQALSAPNMPNDWAIVELTRNPFLEDGRKLHFFQLRLGNALTPALLDTGSQFNMMNWNTQRFPQLRAVKRKLRRNWEINGAIGTFKPVTKILSKNARAGQKFWGDNEFLVLDFKSLDVLGIDGKPFVIAGIPMMKEVAVLIDFENDRLYFAPDGRTRNMVIIN